MKQIHPWADERLLDKAACIYCRKSASTREHVPSRILLDEPYPENFPVVPACAPCNQQFSTDEEYLACLIDCALNGSTDSDNLRTKVKRALEKRPALRSRIEGARHEERGHTVFEIEVNRVKNVILKLSRCHYAYELNDLPTTLPTVGFGPLPELNQKARAFFENAPLPEIWPEVGSGAFIRTAESLERGLQPWQDVQPKRYRYAMIEGHAGHAPELRIVLSDYIWAWVIWPDG